MGDIDIQEARALCDAATAEPWEIIGGNEYLTGVGIMVGSPDGIRQADAEFISASRTLVPALLGALAAAQARVRELEATVQRVDGLTLPPSPGGHHYHYRDGYEAGLAAARAALRGSDV